MCPVQGDNEMESTQTVPEKKPVVKDDAEIHDNDEEDIDQPNVQTYVNAKDWEMPKKKSISTTGKSSDDKPKSASAIVSSGGWMPPAERKRLKRQKLKEEAMAKKQQELEQKKKQKEAEREVSVMVARFCVVFGGYTLLKGEFFC